MERKSVCPIPSVLGNLDGSPKKKHPVLKPIVQSEWLWIQALWVSWYGSNLHFFNGLDNFLDNLGMFDKILQGITSTGIKTNTNCKKVITNVFRYSYWLWELWCSFSPFQFFYLTFFTIQLYKRSTTCNFLSDVALNFEIRFLMYLYTCKYLNVCLF